MIEEPMAWFWAITAAMAIGAAKTGLPGLGILVVALMARAIPGRQSVGVVLPLLIIADCCAVFWYRRFARWDLLLRLFSWVALGLVIGGLLLWLLGGNEQADRWFRPLLGIIVLIMIALHLAQMRYGEHLRPQKRLGLAATGCCTGIATTLANAAGPVMSVYLAGQKVDKQQFLGTMAWFFLILNLSKVPIFLIVSWIHPEQPMISSATLELNLRLLPGVLLGAIIGRYLLSRLPRQMFFAAVICLASIAALSLLW